MEYKASFRHILIVFLFLFVSLQSALGGTVYVDANATGANNGSSWANAYIYLQDALTMTTNGDEIWVAVGTYKPTTDSNRAISFVMKSGVDIYGGFATFETSRDQRNFIDNQTILSGDLLNNDSDDIFDVPTRQDNTYHIIIGANNSTIDGFIITSGNAYGDNDKGAGIYNWQSNPKIVNCIFRSNGSWRFGEGGGIYNYQSSPMIKKCTFNSNITGGKGAGIYNEANSCPDINDSSFNENISNFEGAGIFNGESNCPLITNCTFYANSSSADGGAICNILSSAIITDCTFTQNIAEYDGGGISNKGSSNPTITNCVFIKNRSESGGGGISNRNSNPVISKCSFIENESPPGGGGIQNKESNPLVTKCTFSKNNVSYGGGGMHNRDSMPVLVNCIFKENYASAPSEGAGGGILNEDSNTIVINSLFCRNVAAGSGGGILNVKSSPIIVNCTLIYNSTSPFSSGRGGGMFSNLESNPTLTNSIIWENTAPIGPQVFGPVNITYSDIEGGWTGSGNIDSEPLFVRIPNPGTDGYWGTTDDDYGDLRLLPRSPCIDLGDNNSVLADISDIDNDGNTTEHMPYDLDDHQRIVDGDCNSTSVVDMGSYEFAYLYLGDFAGGCDVDFADFAVLALAWLTEEDRAGYNSNCDIALPYDGAIDEKDLQVFTENWLLNK
jgi:parallel beta-helix repeat protein